jgi:hypothetical protein
MLEPNDSRSEAQTQNWKGALWTSKSDCSGQPRLYLHLNSSSSFQVTHRARIETAWPEYPLGYAYRSVACGIVYFAQEEYLLGDSWGLVSCRAFATCMVELTRFPSSNRYRLDRRAGDDRRIPRSGPLYGDVKVREGFRKFMRKRTVTGLALGNSCFQCAKLRFLTVENQVPSDWTLWGL